MRVLTSCQCGTRGGRLPPPWGKRSDTARGPPGESGAALSCEGAVPHPLPVSRGEGLSTPSLPSWQRAGTVGRPSLVRMGRGGTPQAPDARAAPGELLYRTHQEGRPHPRAPGRPLPFREPGGAAHPFLPAPSYADARGPEPSVGYTFQPEHDRPMPLACARFTQETHTGDCPQGVRSVSNPSLM